MKLTVVFRIVFCTTLLSGCSIRERIDDLMPPQRTLPPTETGSPIQGQILSIGAASASFVPEKPVALSGFGGIGRRFLPPLFLMGGGTAFCRPYERIENPPLIRSAVVSLAKNNGQKEKLFLISLDIVAVTSDITQKVHNTIRTVDPATSPTFTNTTVLATHTHSGPAGLTENPLWSTFVCDQFNVELTRSYLDTLSRVLKEALANPQPIERIETRITEQPTLFKSRFTDMKSASDVQLISFKTPSGTTPLSLVQLAAHPTYFGTRDLVLSADLVAPVESAVKKSSGAEHVFFMQTTVGNMDAELSGATPEAWAQKMGDALFQEGPAVTSTNLQISATAGQIDLPEPKVNWSSCELQAAAPLVSLPILKQLPRTAPYSLWSFAQLNHLFLSGEWTTAAGTQLKNELKEELTNNAALNIFSLANDYTAYHVTQFDYEKVELESCSSLYGNSAVNTFINSLRSEAMNWKL